MPNQDRIGLQRFIGRARRLTRAAIGRFGIGSHGAKPHRPMFSDRTLVQRLGVESTGIDPCAIARTGALAARKLIGPRFFVDPVHIPSLLDRLGAQHTKALAAVFDRVTGDVREGLPIYAMTGPQIGSSFPWHALPCGPGNDSMYAKRPHRFAFAPRHALASLRDPQSAVGLLGMLEAWVKHAMKGSDCFCYDSNLAVIQRVLALSWTWAFLAARPAKESAEGLELEWLVLKIIEADIRFLEPMLGSSAPNNHLLADRFAAWYLRTLVPELLDRPDPHAEQRWADELLAQTYPDGGSFEHSSHYHEFACEMGSAYLLLAKRNVIEADPRLEKRVAALLDYQCALTGPEALPIAIGNAIEDTLFPLDAGESWCPGATREMNRALFRPHLAPAPPDDPTVVRAFWLLAGALVEESGEGMHETLPEEFPDAGLYVLDDYRLAGRLLLRSGPTPGTELAAGHSHADILSVYLHVHGHPLLVDSGTYTYRKSGQAWAMGSPDWRSYLAGRAAHNGFAIASHDPFGPMSDDFRQRDLPGRVTGQHESGAGLAFVGARWQGPGPYDGTQRFCIHVQGEYWLVLDELPATPEHALERWIGFQLAPGCAVHRRVYGVDIALDEGPPALLVTHEAGLGEPEVLEGSLDPLGGWVSPRYGELRPAPQLRYRLSTQTRSAAFLLSSEARVREVRFAKTACHNGSWFIHLQGPSWEDWIIAQPKIRAPWLLGDDRVEFDGLLLWLRQEQGHINSVRWLSASRLEWAARGVRLLSTHVQPFNLALPESIRPGWLTERFGAYRWPGK